MKPVRKIRTPIMLNEHELAEIDDWRYASRVATRSGAIRKLCRLALAASQSRATTEVEVALLKWTELTSPREDGPPEPVGEWEAECIAGIYSIAHDGVEWWLSLATIADVHQLGRSGDPDALRSVAQSDLSGRIRSALVGGE